MSKLVIEIRGTANTGKTFIACWIRDHLIALGVDAENIYHRQSHCAEPVAEIGKIWPLADRVVENLNVVLLEKSISTPIVLDPSVKPTSVTVERKGEESFEYVLKNNYVPDGFVKEEYDTDVELQQKKIQEFVQTTLRSIELLPESIRSSVKQTLHLQLGPFGKTTW